MDRPTRQVLITAGALLLIAGALFVTRYIVLGGDFSGLFAGPRWRVTFHISANATKPSSYVKLLVPPKSYSQHIAFEDHKQEGVGLHFLTEGLERNRVAEWRNTGKIGPKVMSFSFTAQTHPGKLASPPMSARRRAELIPYYLQATDRIQATEPRIQQKARELAENSKSDEERVRSFYRFCAFRIANSYVQGTDDAVTCIENGMSDCGGKSRLMVALCRACGIPARLIGGLILQEGIKHESHVWVEVWQDGQWIPYCPLNNHSRSLPSNYLLLYRGDYPLMRHRFIEAFSYDFELHKRTPYQADAAGPTNRLRRAVSVASFSNLSPSSQWLLKVLLLVPVGALVICVVRNVIGIPTLGTFTPVLIALGIHMAPLRWGIVTLVLFVGLGFLVRWLIDGFKLLLVPRLSVMLTVVVIGVIVFVAVTDTFETPMGAYVGLLPVVILTMSIERSWILELEDGFLTMSKHLLGTLAAMTLIYFIYQWRGLTKALFAMPELLLIIIALMLVVGRYQGFRLSELFRFRSITHEA